MQAASETVKPVADLIFAADRWDRVDRRRADTQAELRKQHIGY